ncbi:MAG: DinB family protein [Lutibacter sp.]
MIEAIEKNLNRGVLLLNQITNEQYTDCSVPPYYSSIGSHIRHILDVFDCIFKGLEINEVNLINRARNVDYEKDKNQGIIYFNQVLNQLNKINPNDFNKIVIVKDDLGLGLYTSKYTLGSLLIQAHSHAIHHFASMGYIIAQLHINLPDKNFGFNPTTPKRQQIQN